MAGLKELNLNANWILESGVVAIIHSAQLKKLTHLNLAENALRPTTAQSIARAPSLQQLTELNLSANQISDDGLQALLQLQSLKKLYLKKCRIGNTGAEFLAHSSLIQQLEELDLSSNYIFPKKTQLLKSKMVNGVMHL